MMYSFSRKMFQNILKKSTQIISKSFASNSVQNALYPVMFLASVLSITPFKYMVKKSKSKTVLSIPLLIWFCLFKFNYFSCLTRTMMYNLSNLKENMHMSILEFSEKFQIYTGFITIVYLMIDSWINKDDLAKIFEIQDDIDLIFKSLGRKRFYHQLKFRMVLITIIYLIVFSVYGSTDAIFKSTQISYWTSFELSSTLYNPVIQVTGTLTMFVAFVYVITLDLAILNEEMTTLSPAQETIVYNLRNAKSSVRFLTTTNLQPRDTMILEKINLIWNVYIKICDCSLVISRYFSGKILAILAMSFLWVLLNFFFLMSSLFKLLNNDVIEGRIFLFAVMQFFINGLCIVAIIYVCNLCEQRSYKSANLITNIMVNEKTKTISLKLLHFSTHMLHVKPQFTAAGLFVINNSLYFTMAGAITTYMIILIQFSISSVK